MVLDGYLTMKTKIYLAKAGTGKSYYATHCLTEFNQKNVYFLTYTNQNKQVLFKNLRSSKLNFNYKKVSNWFTFLMENFIFPFQSYIRKKYTITLEKIDWDSEGGKKEASFSNNKGILYGYKIAALILNSRIYIPAIKRLVKYFNYIVIDEFQDITGDDLRLLQILIRGTVNNTLTLILFGDLCQANVEKTSFSSLYTKITDIENEVAFVYHLYGGINFVEVDNTLLQKSRRITSKNAEFIREKMDIMIYSDQNKKCVSPYLVKKEEISNIFNKVEKILIWNKSILAKLSNIEWKNKAINWGVSKGETYNGSIAVVLPASVYKAYKNNSYKDLKPVTFNKFYVAITRSKSQVYFVYLNN